MKIGFATLGLPFNGKSLSTSSLGGSESACAYLARAFAKRGHEVRVFCECPEPGVYDDVAYFPHQQLRSHIGFDHYDVFIVSRWMEFLAWPIQAGIRVLWLHDMITDKDRVMSPMWNTDRVHVLSDFHRKTYLAQLPELASFMHNTTNGVDLELVQRNLRPKVPGKMIYTSRPERGLHYLLSEIFPKVLAARPDATLYYANYNIAGLQLPPDVAQAIAMSEQLSKQYPGKVINLGHLTKERLYQEISSAEVHLYPTAFPEISCAAEGTLVQMPCDRRKHLHGVPIEELVGRENFPVYAYDSDAGQFTLATCKKVWKTGENRQCVEIDLDDGQTLTVTPEHLVMDFDGNWRRADSFKVGDRVNGFHQRFNVGFKQTNGQWWDEATEVAHWQLGRWPTKQEHVNHLDPTRLNNSPEALEVLSASEHHSKTHTGRPKSARSMRKQLDGFAKHKQTTSWQQGEDVRRENGKQAGTKAWEKIRSWPTEQQQAFFAARAEARRDKKLGRENHKVVAVRVSAKLHTVYDMEVEGLHNFVASGVVIHNCITAMEAQACGTPIITTNDFALRETVGPDSGILIHGNPPNPKYAEDFIAATLNVLNNQILRSKLSKAGPEWIVSQGLTWDAVAEDWEASFDEHRLVRLDKNPTGVFKELIRKNNIQAALDLQRMNQAVDQQCEITFNPNTDPHPKETAHARLRAKIQVFDRIMACLSHGGYLKDGKPTFKSILEIGADDTPFSLYLKQKFPEVELTFLCSHPEYRLRLQAWANAHNVTVRFHRDTGEQFDLVCIGDELSKVASPSTLLQESRKVTSSTGCIVGWSPSGTSTCTFSSAVKSAIRWDFTYQDFVTLFFDRFKAGYLERGMSISNELLGTWAFVADAYQEETPDLQSLGLDAKLSRDRWFNTRPYQTICACMIVKNEEDHLTKCLKAVRPFVDKMIVVDTGSTDHTLDILEQHDVEVRRIQFDNFGAARNESIRDAGTDWLLWLDADETLIGGNSLRKYLGEHAFEGFVLKQQHLMVDLHGTFDVPIRIFRNRTQYRFVGLIHEHAEDTSKGWDEAIHPSLVLPDAELAHYGYLNERMRRRKCSNRNMELLRRDLVENPNRKLGKILAIRDFLNICKWTFERGVTPKPGDDLHQLLNAVVEVYMQSFSGMMPGARFHDLAFPMYQEALTHLARYGLGFEDRSKPPFNVAFALAGNFGPVSDASLKPEKIWFIDDNQFMQFMQYKAAALVLQLGITGEWKYKRELGRLHQAPYKVTPNAAALLKLGTNVISTGEDGLLSL